MKRIIPLATFDRMARKLSIEEKRLLKEALQNFNHFLTEGALSAGLGYKKLAEDKYEFRAGLKLRVLLKVEKTNYYLVMVGNHDDIRRQLKNL